MTIILYIILFFTCVRTEYQWLKLTSMQSLDWMPNTEHSRCWTSYSDALYYSSRSNLAEEIAIFHESNLAEVLSNWFPGYILEIKEYHTICSWCEKSVKFWVRNASGLKATFQKHTTHSSIRNWEINDSSSCMYVVADSIWSTLFHVKHWTKNVLWFPSPKPLVL